MYVPVCSFQNHLWFKRKHLYYVAWGMKSDYQRYKLRFCDAHTAIVEENLAKFEIGSLDGTAGHSDLVVVECLACGEPIHEIGWQWFITGYPTENERKDYWGGLHVDCRLPSYLLDAYSSTPV